MKTTLRFAGAQIPVTPFVAENTRTIKRAIDWAADNKVDYLVTPEAALSGYTPDFCSQFNNIVGALAEIEKYAAMKNVGLCLGTLWDEREYQETTVRRNQLRFYKNDGLFLGAANKILTIEHDAWCGARGGPAALLIALPVGDSIVPVGGLLCVDMFGIDGTLGIPGTLINRGARLLVHATNGVRNTLPTNGSSRELSDKINNDWADINLRRRSFLSNVPIITVDNCYMIDGTEYNGPTSSESGVIIKGEWVTNVPRTGTQYFYHDFPTDDLTIEMPLETAPA